MRDRDPTLAKMVAVLETMGLINSEDNREKRDQLQLFIQIQTEGRDKRYTDVFTDGNLDKINAAIRSEGLMSELHIEDLHRIQALCEVKQSDHRNGYTFKFPPETINEFKAVTDDVLEKIGIRDTAKIDVAAAKKEHKAAKKEYDTAKDTCAKHEKEETKLNEKINELKAKMEGSQVTEKKLGIIKKEIDQLKQRLPALEAKVKTCKSKVTAAKERLQKAEKNLGITRDEAPSKLRNILYTVKEMMAKRKDVEQAPPSKKL